MSTIPSPSPRRILAAVLTVTALGAGAGCGGDAPDGAPNRPRPVPSSSAPASSPSTPAASSPAATDPAPPADPVSPVGSWRVSGIGSSPGLFGLTVKRNGKVTTVGRPGRGAQGSGTDLCFGTLTGDDTGTVSLRCVNTQHLGPGRADVEKVTGRTVTYRNTSDDAEMLLVTWQDGTRDFFTKTAG
ncbi:hypothetical protein AB0D65_21420 [Streptomyces griseoloalbus]|uniref:Lipoprotein n=1 Tax=Streptomyces griseoloalbus TaxID=67303 RepID=A0ABV3E8L5_9ACTN